MARDENVQLQYAHKGFDIVIPQYKSRRNRAYKSMVRVMTMNEAYMWVGSDADLPTAPIVNPNQPLDDVDFSVPFERKYGWKKRGHKFSYDRAMKRSDVFGLIAKIGPKLIESIERAKEIDVAGFMNYATGSNADLVTPDGLSIANAAHPLANGFYSNIIATNPALSADAVANAANAMLLQPSYGGNPEGPEGPFDLWVHPNLRARAVEIMKTVGQWGTANNNFNFAGSLIADVKFNRYFQSTMAWALVARDEENPFVFLDRDPLRSNSWYDGDFDQNRSSVTEGWGLMPKDWRGFAYSAGG
ncbi:hypothetical protein EON81_16735 [bacterium]|nr:MAG: hypothetical protein EON81_16735 [bacterium]